MSVKLKTPLESLIMRLFKRTVSGLLFDFMNNKQFPYMCIYMNMNVESHLPLAKKNCSIYISIVFVPFHEFAQAFPLIGFHVNSSSALGLAPGSPITHIWMEICVAFPASIVPREKKKIMGEPSQTWRSDVLYLIQNCLCCFEDLWCKFPLATEAGHTDKLLGKTQYHSGKFLWEKAEKQETKWERLEVMSSTGSCLDTRPVSQLYNWLFSSKTPSY